jgi:hypothetical protein
MRQRRHSTPQIVREDDAFGVKDTYLAPPHWHYHSSLNESRRTFRTDLRRLQAFVVGLQMEF